jgi:hypothetical protein
MTALVPLCVLALAGASRALMGALPLLWTGRTSPRGFWSLLVLGGAGLAAVWLAWGLSAAWVLRLLGASLGPAEAIGVVAVATAPMLLALVGLFPFVGGIAYRVLVALNLGLMVLGLAAEAHVGLGPALVAAAPGAVLLLLLLALLGRLTYSARQPSTGPDRPPSTGATPAREPGAGPAAGSYLVYLQGVSAYSRDYVPHREEVMLELLAARVPALVLVSDVFAYDMRGVGLGPPHVFWRWAHRERLRRSAVSFLGRLINLRNLLLLAVSADRRYAAVYCQGLAAVLGRALAEHGYPSGSRRPVTLLGYSGGVQLAAGAAAYLARDLDAPVRVISVGGVLWNDHGFDHLEHFYDLLGTRDRVRRLAMVLFPARWRPAVRSEWNQARSQGRVTRVVVGPMDHTGPGGYFDLKTRLPDGRTYVEATAASIVAALP